VLALLLAAALQLPPERAVDPYALTISGGVSLGAYEAGLNWALVRSVRIAEEHALRTDLRRRPQLVAVTGASAGALNALLAASLWCEEAGQDESVDSNLLRDAWVPLGLDELLPDDTARYDRADGLFARRALAGILGDIRSKVLTPGGRSYRPGCRIALGVTVTRVEPGERDVGGVPALTQRFALPWMFDVDARGRARITRLPLGPDRDLAGAALALGESEDGSLPADEILQALLASSAFPVVFSARDLCDCSAACPSASVMTSGSCPGFDDGRPTAGLACKATSGGAETKLCRRSYLDGGVFDNAPVGLAIDLAESWISPAPMHPITYLFVDPDLRRLQPQIEHAGPNNNEPRGLKGNLALLRNLIATARNVELSRTIQARSWNRTTQAVLRDVAIAVGQFAYAHEMLGVLGGGGRPVDMRLPYQLPPAAERTRLGRLMASCIPRTRQSEEELIEACSQAARGLPGTDPLAGDAEQMRRQAEPLSPMELVRLADDLVTTTTEWLKEEAARPPIHAWTASQERRFRSLTRDRMRLAAAALQFLAGEVERVAHSSLPDEHLRRFKSELLGASAAASGHLSAVMNQMAAAVLDEQLRMLAAQGLPSISVEAARASSSLRALPVGELYAVAIVDPVLAAIDVALADPALAARQRNPVEVHGVGRADRGRGDGRELLAFRRRQLQGVRELRPLLQQLTATAASLGRTAGELQKQDAAERRLRLSSRFPSLAGSQLYNFAAFLDRPLRELDYAAGVYDAVHEVALELCSKDPPFLPLPVAPAFHRDAPGELDLSSEDTQRCIGIAMNWIAERLKLRESEQVRQVVFMLAPIELAAALGDLRRAMELLGDPSWAWLDTYYTRDPGEPFTAALDALTARRQACSPSAREALCLTELSFDEFLDELVLRDYRGRDPAMRLALADRAAFWSNTLRKGMDRSMAIEASERGGEASSLGGKLLVALSAGQLWTRRDLSHQDTPRLELDPSTIPAAPLSGASRFSTVAAHLLPYRASLDIARGGLALAWVEPALRLRPWLSLMSSVEPVDLEFSPQRASSSFGLRPTVHLGPVSLGAGPRLAVHWRGGIDWGAVAQLGLLQDRLELVVGPRSISQGKAEDILVSLSFSDLNGMLYWLALWGE
jgi:predicted acylesterase/phospholipase RssA